MRKDGSAYPVEANLSHIIINEEECMIAVARDITERLKLERKLDEHIRELERMQSIISETVLYTTSDLKGNITYISDALLNLTGYQREELIGRNHRIFKHKTNSETLYKEIWETIERSETWRGELRNRSKNGGVFWFDLTIRPIFDTQGEKIGYYSYRENITEKKRSLFLSEHDPLTSIWNRRKGNEILEQCAIEAKRYGVVSALILFDIDHFKRINDTYGHQTGDEVLVALTRVVTERTREADYLIRWGGEEFVIIMPHCDDTAAAKLADALRREIAEYAFESVNQITCSFGISRIDGGHGFDEAVRIADERLYASKQNGRNRVT